MTTVVWTESRHATVSRTSPPPSRPKRRSGSCEGCSTPAYRGSRRRRSCRRMGSTTGRRSRGACRRSRARPRPASCARSPTCAGLELALAHGVRNVLVTIAATDSFNRRNVNRSVRASMRRDLADRRAAATSGCTVDVAVSVSFGCPFEGPSIPNACSSCARTSCGSAWPRSELADTIGVATPADVTAMCALVGGAVRTGRLSLHVHDTRGLGVANVIAGFEAGVRRFDGSVGGDRRVPVRSTLHRERL